MESTEETGISLIITEDGQYNLVNVNQSDANTGLGEGTEVIMQQGEDGVEVVYIVQPEARDHGVTYTVEGTEVSDEVRLVDENGSIINASDINLVNSGDGNIVMISNEVASQPVMPDESGDRADKAEEEEDVEILLFCQYCGENLLTLGDLRVHLKEEHDVDDDMQSETEEVDDPATSLFPSCPDCMSTFMDEEDLKAHKTKCVLVKEEPDNVDEDTSYVEEPGGIEGHKCQLCAQVFRVRSDLDVHIEKGIHGPLDELSNNTGPGVQSMYHKCPYCPRMYMSKWHKKSLIKHIKDEHPEESWDVPFKLVEVKNTGLFRRLNAERGGYQSCFQCIYCNRKFLWQKSLARHYKDYHQDRLDTLGDDEVAELLGKKHNRSVTVPGDQANVSCDNCGKQFKWEKSLKRHSFECNKSKGLNGNLLKCLYCSLVSRYTCSLRKHMKRFHYDEVAGLNINKIDLPVVDMETYGHNVLSIDRRPADERLKDCPIVFKCKFCDYVTPGQSNLKRHLMSIKHNYTDEELRKMKLSSFKVYQKPKTRSAGRPRKHFKENVESISDDKHEGKGGQKNTEKETNNVKDIIENKTKDALDDVIDVEQSQEDTAVGLGRNEKADGTEDDELMNSNPGLQSDLESPICLIDSDKTNDRNRKDAKSKGFKANKSLKGKDKIVTERSDTLLLEPDAIFCSICNNKFDEFQPFLDHCQFHVNLKIDFMCSHCTETFPIFESLKKHHARCHKSLKFTGTRMNSVSLEEVKLQHSRIKAFECPYCELIFSQSDPLREHVSEEHRKYVLSIAIKTEPIESGSKNSSSSVVSGLRCGFCECTYGTIEDMINHMQSIHPFVDKSTLGQGSSDSGSVRKSGRKRKAKYPEDEYPVEAVKKQKIDFRSPAIAKKLKTVESSSRTVINNGSPGTLQKATEETSQTTPSKVGTTSNQQSKMDSDLGNRKQSKPDTPQETKTGKNLQPIVSLGKKVDSPGTKQATIVTEKNITLDTAQSKQENIVKHGKKRGRKRKEVMVVAQNVPEKSTPIQRNISSDVASEKKCPHCNFFCKRSSALTFHINFNHTNIKEEPLDPDVDLNYKEDIEKSSPRKRKNRGPTTSKLNIDGINEDVELINKSLEKDVQPKCKAQDKRKKVQTTKAVKPVVSEEEMFDDEVEDFEMFDDSDADQDYQPDAVDDSDDEVEDAEATQLRYKCPFCENKELTSRGFESHVKKEHPENVGSYSIEECQVTELDDDDNLSVHVKNIPHLHKCVYCSKQYNSKEKVINHVKAAHRKIISTKAKMSFGKKVKPKTVASAMATRKKRNFMFKCSVCNFLCKSKLGLTKHMVRLHPDSSKAVRFITELDMNTNHSLSNRFQCPYCRYKTYYRSSIIRHVKNGHPQFFDSFNPDSFCSIVPNEDREREKREKVPENGTFFCPYCGIINKWKKSIVRHIRVAHPDEPYDIDIDPVRNPEIRNGKKYERLNIGFKKTLQCLHCSFSCKILTHMKKHIAKSHDQKDDLRQANYQYVYEKQNSLVDSQEAWMDDGQQEVGIHTCPICGCTYGWKKSLGLHVKKAHPDMTEVYESMEKMLTVLIRSTGQEKLQKHSKKNRCSQCGVVCTSEGLLLKHKLLKHSTKARSLKRPYLPRYVTRWKQKVYRPDKRYRSLVCKECEKPCTNLLSLRTHAQIYHPAELECVYEDCKARFKWKSVQKRHLQRKHKYEFGKGDIIKCEMCNTVLNTSEELQAHIVESHLSKKRKRRPFVYRCKACSVTFDSANTRDQHFAFEHIELTEMCEICGGVFTNKKQLQLHTKRHAVNHVESTTICDHCGMTMGKKSLRKHLLFKHPEKLACKCAICSGIKLATVKSVKCDMCSRSFCRKMFLYSHKRLVHNIKDRVYKCKVCMASFASQKKRNIHLHEEHLNVKLAGTSQDVEGDRMDVWTTDDDKDRTTHVIHVGQDRGAQYLPKLSEPSLGAVIKELMIISSEKNNRTPFKCLLCGRAFGKSKYIKLHIRRNHVKDEDKPYRCKVCGSGFVRLTEFRKHSRSHSGFRPYKCRVCNKAFKQQANLIDHMHIHKDSKDFQCFICKRHFQQRGGMTSHILTHDTLKPFKCMFCEKGFTSRGELSRHMQKYTSQMAESKTFLCHICQTSFLHYPLLLRHIETHNPEKPFSCEVCGLKFASFMSLYNHKLKLKHFLLSDIQIGEEEEVTQAETTQDALNAVASLEADLYENVQTLHSGQGEEETIYVSEDGSYVRDHSDINKTTISIEPMEAEEIVQTSQKLHDNEELLSIAKQLTELSTYTENDNMIEFSVIHDEDEIMKGMLDADTEILASIEKQSVKPKAVLEPKRRKVPETLEEILHYQQMEPQDHGETYIEEQEEQNHHDQVDVIEEEVVEQENQMHVDQKPVVNEIVTSGEIPTNVEELAALIAQSSQGLETADGITAYETEDGVIYVCMPENLDSNSYEEVLNSAVQSITSENTVENQVEIDDNNQKGVGEMVYAKKEDDMDVPVIHVNINDDIGKTEGETYTTGGYDQSNMDLLEQDKLNLYGESNVEEIGNDERTFIKEELLDDGFEYEGGNKFILENGIFTYQTCKLRYLIAGRVFKCLECGKCSKTKKRLKDHLKRHIPVEHRENACRFCPSRFVTANELARHLAVHTDDRRYKCKLCPKSFRQPGHLTEHQLIHQNLRPHNCTQCFQSFRTKRQLVVHSERKHSTAKYKCEECHAVLNSKTGLIIHKGSVHSTNFRSAKKGRKEPIADGGDFQCDKCGAAFSTGIRLKRHIAKVHGGKRVVTSKSFMCEVCGSMYQSKDYLKEHILTAHTDELTEICDQCGDKFKTTRLLQLHKRRVHSMTRQNTPIEKKSHLCTVCQKAFSTRHALAYHIGVTPACKNYVE